jgi:hypothetical protein
VPNVRCRITSVATVGGLAILASLAVPAIGQAALVAPTSCTIGPLSQPFLAWGDRAAYEQVPGGDFEGALTDWTLQGGTALVSDSDPFGVTGSVGSSSLQLPPGAVAVAPATCVNIPHPAARLFVRSASAGAQLRVQAVYNDGQRAVTIPAGPAVRPTVNWQPTKPLKIHPVVIPALHASGTALVALEFSATHGTVEIDDVFVDPRQRG